MPRARRRLSVDRRPLAVRPGSVGRPLAGPITSSTRLDSIFSIPPSLFFIPSGAPTLCCSIRRPTVPGCQLAYFRNHARSQSSGYDHWQLFSDLCIQSIAAGPSYILHRTCVYCKVRSDHHSRISVHIVSIDRKAFAVTAQKCTMHINTQIR